MEFTKETGRIALYRHGEAVAYVTFPLAEPKVAEINHTFVSDELRGQGVAAKLLQAGLITLLGNAAHLNHRLGAYAAGLKQRLNGALQRLRARPPLAANPQHPDSGHKAEQRPLLP